MSGWFKGPPLLDVDFLIDDVFREAVPLDIEALKNSRTLMTVPVTNVKTGKVKYFSNKDDVDFFEILRASKAVPILYNKPVGIDGELYCDGAINDPIPINLPGVRDSRKIIILTTPRNRKKDYEVFAYLFRARLGGEIYETLRGYEERCRGVMDQISTLEEEGDILIQPSRKMSSMDNRRKSIERFFEYGYEDAVSNKKLADFINSLRESERSDFYFPSLQQQN